MDLWHLNNYDSYLNTLNAVLIVFLFLVLILSILLTIEPTNLKKSYFRICKKDDQIFINLTNVLDYIG